MYVIAVFSDLTLDEKIMRFFLTIFVLNRLVVSDNGLAALVRLSSGDMRKALNILQVWKPPTNFLVLVFSFVSLSW